MNGVNTEVFEWVERARGIKPVVNWNDEKNNDDLADDGWTPTRNQAIVLFIAMFGTAAIIFNLLEML